MTERSPSVRGYVRVGDSQLHYREAGRAGPWLALLHESPLSSIVYERVLGDVAAWCRPIAWDTPGYGMSDRLGGEQTVENYAALLAEAMCLRTGAEPYYVAGVHTGASIAMEMAHQSDHVSGAILMGPPLYSAEESADRLANWAPTVRVADDGAHLDWAWSRYSRLWPDATPQMKHMAVCEVLRVVDHYEDSYRAAFAYDARAALARMPCPALIVAAEGEPLQPAAQSAARAFDHQYQEVPGRSGQIPLVHPKRFSQICGQFMVDCSKTRRVFE